MTDLTFKIDRNDKPLIYVDSGENTPTSCLIDTGANMPVWFVGEDYLSFRFPDATFMNKKTFLTGIGKEPLLDIPVWEIPEFVLTGDNNEKITFKNVPIAVINTNKFSFDMIIPLTMLNRMNMSFLYMESANHGAFRLSASKNVFFVRPIYNPGNRYLNKIQIFTEG